MIAGYIFIIFKFAVSQDFLVYADETETIVISTSIAAVSLHVPSRIVAFSNYSDDGISVTENCKNTLEEVIFETGSKLEALGSYSFYQCSKLKSFQVPSSVQFIGSYCFSRCSSLLCLYSKANAQIWDL